VIRVAVSFGFIYVAFNETAVFASKVVIYKNVTALRRVARRGPRVREKPVVGLFCECAADAVAVEW